ncbi:MAG: hypothetical protein WC979_00325 [Candidatus Pacearchaeota archaeon]|jgi:hypothetical protein|nr:hypothetical protein [Clostridia bacterium]
MSQLLHLVQDIEGVKIEVGDTVYYARKRDYTANGELIKKRVTAVDKTTGYVEMGKYTSTSPESQLLVLLSDRKTK